jgi:hypothetical protein
MLTCASTEQPILYPFQLKAVLGKKELAAPVPSVGATGQAQTHTDKELKKKNIRHGFPQYDLPDLQGTD